MIYTLAVGEKTRSLEIRRTEAGWCARLDGREIPLDAEAIDRDTLSLLKNVVRVLAREGDKVSPNQGIVVIDAM